ncbi:hypothetical protein EYZ11_013493 [Aspergillus tanneri]|uniref:Uncharacterized protein n=1 Tax=Aspergillus tanneri TaxID=1220188 RepID=A0A4S3J2Y4_9EURO|nr:hypothetical protein EYZ11_013493 [Aspergillus tanneri]
MLTDLLPPREDDAGCISNFAN